MIKNKINILIIIIFSVFLNSCQAAKDALQGNKRSEQSDEFLVEKKNPLVLPPDYEKLPVPGNQENSTEKVGKSSEVKKLLSIGNDGQNEELNTREPVEIESAIIKKIK
tara:strand:- start:3026 stop:3352 length:327 start_codon:yes stop_codon:yes gene_type:complete